MCRDNAAERIARQNGMSGRDAAALDELARLLGLSAPPVRIESYDISNTGGSDNVAGMVVFENGRPLKAGYRKFKIKTVDGQDDYASMREVLSRRMEEYEAHRGGQGLRHPARPDPPRRREGARGGRQARGGPVRLCHTGIRYGQGQPSPHPCHRAGRRRDRHRGQTPAFTLVSSIQEGGPPLRYRLPPAAAGENSVGTT